MLSIVYVRIQKSHHNMRGTISGKKIMNPPAYCDCSVCSWHNNMESNDSHFWDATMWYASFSLLGGGVHQSFNPKYASE